MKPALLTRTEIEWLLGRKQVSKSYEYFMRNSIKSKLKTFTDLELPLLIKNDYLDGSSDSRLALRAGSKNLSANSKVTTDAEVAQPGRALPWEGLSHEQKEASLGRDSDPRPLPYQGNALPG
jgi:hypothetical protein